jgi:hypothetical protein
MDQIGQTIADSVAGLLGDPIVGLAIKLAAAYLVIVWLAVALWSFLDMRRRTRNLVAAYASASMVILASPVLFPFAVIVHRIIRPEGFSSDQRLSELRQRALEVETVAPRCPDCNTVVAEDWLVCPACRRSLGHRCRECGRTAALDWAVCAWCAVDLDGMHFAELSARA